MKVRVPDGFGNNLINAINHGIDDNKTMNKTDVIHIAQDKKVMKSIPMTSYSIQIKRSRRS